MIWLYLVTVCFQMSRVRVTQGSTSITLTLSLSIAALLATSCARKPPKPQIDSGAYAREIDQWHQQRWAELESESGWLSLVGLFWLKEALRYVVHVLLTRAPGGS